MKSQLVAQDGNVDELVVMYSFLPSLFCKAESASPSGGLLYVCWHPAMDPETFTLDRSRKRHFVSFAHSQLGEP